MKILVVVKEPDLLRSILAAMQREKHRCEAATDDEDALEKITLYHYDLVIIDVSQDVMAGLDLIRQQKSRGSEAGIIILSPDDTVDTKVTALEAGADDYLAKPFHLSELVARVRSLLRRIEFGGKREINLGELKLIPELRLVKVNDQALELTRKEYDLFVYLLSNRNRLLTKQAIAEYLRGEKEETVESYDFIYSHVKNLRKKIIEKGGSDCILTFYGVGYKYNAG